MSPASNNEPALTETEEAMVPEESLVYAEDAKGRPLLNGVMRRDITSGETVDTDGLIRFVVSPEGVLTPDLLQKLPGRGMWVDASRAALEIAIKKNIFSRSAKRQVKADPALIPLVHDLLRRRCLDLLGLARREGGIVNGFEKTLASIRSGKAAWIVEASDGSEDGRRRVLALAAAVDQSPRLCGCFNNAELSLALGTENAIHAALLTGRRVQRWSLEMKRLSGFEPLTPQAWELGPPPQ